MKKIIFFIAALLAVGTIEAQTSVNLQINHLFGGQPYAEGATTTNNIGHHIKVSRVAYYISQISIVHDGGQETPVDETWFLVKAKFEMNEELGSFDVNTIEGIKFYIGVEEEYNHLDPSQYPSHHPLAPQSPSMHWGWAGGYRFLAFEGDGAYNYDQMVQLHGLGDEYYHQVVVSDLDLTANDGEVTIALDAEYVNIIKDIEVNEGMIIHGSYAEALIALENMRDHVFTPAALVATDDLVLNNALTIYNNPTSNGEVTLSMDTDNGVFDIQIVDVQGREVARQNNVLAQTQTSIALPQHGIYVVQIWQDNQLVATTKVISQ